MRVSHALIHYDNVRVPARGAVGRRGPSLRHRPDPPRWRTHPSRHAHRSASPAQALDMMCERALSRADAGSLLADKQFVQGFIADSYAQLTQFRLFVLQTAWEIDKYNDYKRVPEGHRGDQGRRCPRCCTTSSGGRSRSTVRSASATRCRCCKMMHGAAAMGLVDGPTEVHKTTVARQVLRDHSPADDMWPTEWLPRKRDAARAKLSRLPRRRSGQSVRTAHSLAGSRSPRTSSTA